VPLLLISTLTKLCTATLDVFASRKELTPTLTKPLSSTPPSSDVSERHALSTVRPETCGVSEMATKFAFLLTELPLLLVLLTSLRTILQPPLSLSCLLSAPTLR